MIWIYSVAGAGISLARSCSLQIRHSAQYQICGKQTGLAPWG